MNEKNQSISLQESLNDTLTGLFSRSYFHEALSREINKAKICNLPLTLALVDIDNFSTYNDLHGYFQGDSVLKKVGEIIRRYVRQFDIACKYKEDEFGIIFPNTTPQEVLSIIDQIRSNSIQKFSDSSSKSNHPVTFSTGIATAPKDAGTANELINKAQKALSLAKIQGKNQCNLYTSTPQFTHNGQPTILLVDDMASNINYIEHILTPMNYTFLKASNGLEALSVVRHQKPDLILLDVMMPILDGFEVCRQLKQDEHTRLIPIILLTSLTTLKDQIMGVEVGADDYLIKPFEELELIAKVKSFLRMKSLNDQLENFEHIIFSLANAIEAKDRYTIGHTERVKNYAIELGKQIGLGDYEINSLKMGGILHDIGKISVPENVLNKPGPLDSQEWEIIKKHPEVGYTICLPLKNKLGDALDIIRYHHEKLNGTGYPEGLRGDAIPLLARIITIADIYDALTFTRPYRKYIPKMEALKIIKKEALEGLLDKELVHQFERLIK